MAIVDGNSSSQDLFGSTGDDVITGFGGDDALTGDTGNDVFAYTARLFGDDLINDFVQGEDRINLSALGIADFALLQPFIAGSGADSVISFFFNGQFESITIVGVAPNQLAPGDFIFNTDPAALTPTSSLSDDLLFGGNGNDTLGGGQGDDTLIGGAGTDTFVGGAGFDTLTGGVGGDIFSFTARRFDANVITDFDQGEDRINLAALGIADLATLAPFITQNLGNTLISFFYGSEAENIEIKGVLPNQLTANDFIFNVATTALTPASTGLDDILFGGSGGDQLNGGQGDDTLVGGAGGDTLIGGFGYDTLTGGSGSDIFNFNARQFDDDVITDFVPGVDRINLSAFGVADFASLAPFIYQVGANSLIEFFFAGVPEAITITGVLPNQLSAGDFVFRTSSTPVAPASTAAADVLFGGAGADTLSGGGGDDSLTGGGGSDTILGGTGRDFLTGGAGADVFRGTAAELNSDTITDFAVGDRITFSGVSAPGSAPFTFSLNGAFLTYTGGTLGFDSMPAGYRFVATPNAAETGVDLTLQRAIVRNDFNGDGRSDLLWRNSNGQLSSWLGSSNGALNDNGAVVNQFVPTSWRIQGTADFNGDGRSDVLWRNVNGQLSNWLGTANGGLADNGNVVNQFVSLDWKIAGTGDFNGDGRADIVWRNDNGRLSQWLGTANGGLSDNFANVNAFVPTAWKIAGTGDFNGDSFSDVLWRNDNGQLSQWLGSASGALIDNGVNVNQFVPNAWKIAGTGDFNGDGFSDVLWRNDNGQLSEWLGSTGGRLIDNGAVVNQFVPTAWRIQGTGDFNGDGRADIAWRNVSGQLSEWLGTAHGGFVDNGAVVNQVVPNAWTIYIQDYQLI